MLEYDEEKRIIKRLLQRSKEVPFHKIRDAVEAAETPPCDVESVLWRLLERGEAVKIMTNYYDVDEGAFHFVETWKDARKYSDYRTRKKKAFFGFLRRKNNARKRGGVVKTL